MEQPPLTLPLTAALRRGRISFLACAWLLLAAMPGLADIAYVAATTPLTAGPGSGEKIASLQVAAAVDVVETQGAWQRVVLHGWARQGAERALFARPGQRILVAAVAPDAVDGLSLVGSQTDPETQHTWQQFEIGGWVDAAHTSPTLEPIWSEAWELFATRCTVCHVRRVPSHYTANQWRSHLKVMGPRTGLPKEQQARILTFLQHHASDTVESEIAGGTAYPPAAGR